MIITINKAKARPATKPAETPNRPKPRFSIVPQDAHIKISIQDGMISRVEQVGHMAVRGESSLKMVIDALIGLFQKRSINKDIVIHVGDFPDTVLEKNHFYYCVADRKDLPHAVPDFVADSWTVAGVENYTDTLNEIIARGKMPFESDRLFWIGNVQTHSNRTKLMEIAQAHPDKIEAYSTFIGKALKGGADVPYVSLPDHCKYKYLIDIEGVGYSGRIPFLLATGRVLFIQERKWKSWFHFDLEAYKHFIPVKNDLSDLLKQLVWVDEQGDDFYQKITKNALEFVQSHLTYQKAVEIWQQRLLAE
ncbi:glycosyl transferase family 90 [Cricetibacter osteomyelitidis]|uniref:Glycosyl transferase family 90 n=1 Tax=Cricetibacter osteomyelitidis TaxID=1521931 RepID=A0A4R2TPG3_9PAST|nr:glycosyl transferase family 90 [Cricetibacter osteomyelitidis]TCP96852.1 glycosyl transferase family 90 [Cricetibacter osteomyelitidis]